MSWIGHQKHEDLDSFVSFPGEPLERLHFRFTRHEAEDLDDLKFALGKPLSHTVTALLVFGTKDERVLQMAAPGFLQRSFFSLKEGTYSWR